MKRLHFGFESLLKGVIVAGLLAVGLQPLPVAAAPFAYVANLLDSSITVIDVATASVVTTIQGKAPCLPGPCYLIFEPGDVAITRDGQYAWVANEGANFNFISVIGTASNAVVNVVPAETAAQLPSCMSGGLCRGPGSLAINPKADGSGRIWAYVTNQVSGTVSVIDTASALTNTTPTTYTVSLPRGARPYKVAVTPDGTQVWVTDAVSSNVYVIDAGLAVSDHTSAVSTITLPEVCFEPSECVANNGLGVAISPDGAFAYVSDCCGMGSTGYVIWQIDTATKGEGIIIVFPMFGGPGPALVVTPDGSQVYFTSQEPGSGGSLDVEPPKLGMPAGVQVGNNPFGIAIAPPGSAAFTSGGNATFVTNSGSNTVSVVNTTTFTAAVPDIPVGSDPLGITIQGSLTGQASSGSAAMAGVPLNLLVTEPNANLVASVRWDFFSNGSVVQTTSTLNAKYAYPAPGTYLPTVTVRNPLGGVLLTKTIPVLVQSTGQGIATAMILVNLLKSLTATQQASLVNILAVAYRDLSAGNRAAASSQISLFISQVNGLVQTGHLTAKAAAPALSEANAIQISLAQSSPALGTGELTPKGGSSEVGEPVTFTATWTVPEGKSWRSLQQLDLRLVVSEGEGENEAGDGEANHPRIALWGRFNGFDVGNPSASTLTFALLDENGNVVGVGEPGSTAVLETSTATLDLSKSSFQGSGPTGQSVTVNFVVSFKKAAAGEDSARVYQSQLLAGDALQGVQGPEELGHWVVRSPDH
jgi:YVTN family beta-propeller protein